MDTNGLAGDGLVLVGWLVAGRCPADGRWVHVTPLRATPNASIRAGYPPDTDVDVAHGCMVAAVLDPEPEAG